MKETQPVDFLESYKQKHGYSYGPAALAMIFRCYGLAVSELDVIRDLDPNFDSTGWDHITNYLDELGMNYQFKTSASYKELVQDFKKHRAPILVFWENYRLDVINKGIQRFSVVKHVAPGIITLADPGKGDFHTMTEKKFVKHWYGNNLWYTFLIIFPATKT